MSCPFKRVISVPAYDPVSLRKFRRQIEVDCGRCLNCLIKKQMSLQFLCNRELIDVYRSGRGASFVTLTYDDQHLPVTSNGHVTLRKADVQKWLKNIRRQMDYHNEAIPFKVVYCGEYGDQFQRPHYHIMFIGLSDAVVAKYSRKLWKHGLTDIGPLAQGGLRYILKYMTKSHSSPDIKVLRESCGVENPFICHSIGIGKDWIIRNVDKIAASGYRFEVNGRKFFFPRYVCRFVAAHTGIAYRPFFEAYYNKCRRECELRGESFDCVQQEDAEIHLLQNIAAARSRGLTVLPEDAALKKYIRPRSRNYRPSQSLADEALYSQPAFSPDYKDYVPF